MYDVTIIGCGVIGASVAYQLARYKLNILLLERENDVAMGTTKANSAIVHAGYDPPHGTLMAKLNIRGVEMMEALCRDLSVGYRRIGSLVLAFSQADMAHLQKLYENGVQNGVPELALLTGEQVRQIEPKVASTVCGALHAPSAAIIDPWGLCIAQAEVAVTNGADLKLRTEVTAIDDADGHYVLHTTTGDYQSRYVINCAGVRAEEITRMLGNTSFKTIPSRGQYYLLDKSSGDVVNHVIFQCPTASGKGILVSPTVHGNLIVGPSAEPVEDVMDKATSLEGLDTVAASAHKSVPELDLRQSIRNFAGIRANTDQSDFVITQGAPRLLHVAGIKSPGLSAAPAIGEYVCQLLIQMGIQLTAREDFVATRQQIRFKAMGAAEKAALIAQNPLYGRVICRCETITEGEIVAAIHSPIPPCSIDGIKRRAGAGMGRCQGGFCGPRVLEILARELKVRQQDIMQDQDGTYLIVGQTKGGV